MTLGRRDPFDPYDPFDPLLIALDLPFMSFVLFMVFLFLLLESRADIGLVEATHIPDGTTHIRTGISIAFIDGVKVG